MDRTYISEDGHYFSNEEFFSYAIWKIQDLKDQHFNEDEIINFDDSEMWCGFTKKFLENKFSNYVAK